MKTKINDTIDFVNYLRGNSFVDINYQYSTQKTLKEIFGKPQGFFVCGLGEKLKKRSSDKDIRTKKYFVVDIDIRLDYLKEKKYVLTQDEMEEQAELIIAMLEIGLFDDYAYSVMTGNGIHLYFTGEEQNFGIKEYEYGVSAIFDKIDELLKDTPYKTDKSTSNIGRLARLPGTLNPRKKTEVEFVLDTDGNKIKKDGGGFESVTSELFNMGDVECFIIKKQEQSSKWFEKIKGLAKEKLEGDEIETALRKHKAEESIFKKRLSSSADSNYELICEVPIIDIFQQEFGFELKYGKYFYSGSKREGVVYFERENKIYHGGSSAWGWGTQGAVYNPYGYIKTRHNLDDAGVFKRFEENYQHIKENADNVRKDWADENKKPIIQKQTSIQVKDNTFEHNGHYFTFGLDHVDKSFGMPETGDLVLFAGYPGSGKTEYAYFLAKKNSLKTRVLYFTLELPEDSMKKRVARSSAGITKYELQTKSYTDRQKIVMDKKLEELNKYTNIDYIAYEESPRVEDVIQEIKSRDNIEFVIIDALGNMGGDSSEIVRFSHITKQLRLLVKNNNVCVVLVHHMNKPKTDVEAMKPGGLAKLRGTQKIVDDSSIIVEVRRDQDPELEDMREKAEVKLYQYKDTMGGTTGHETTFYNKGTYEKNFNPGF